jgi:phosphoadenosine phosphosulfate reductase
MRYDLGEGWKLLLRMEGARRVATVATRSMVKTDDGARPFILDGKNLMAPGVVSSALDIKKGDEVIVIDSKGHALATGAAKLQGDEMVGGKGAAVKVRWFEAPKPNSPAKGKHDWREAAEVNRPVIEERVAEAVDFVGRIMAENSVLAAVSFSGGKDSLATLLVTRDAGLDLPVFFIDTGLEFQETVDYVYDIAKTMRLQLMVERAPENAFFGNLVHFGPPGRDYRWCCKTNKLGPTVLDITKHFPGGVISFIGQRKYESEQRADKPRVWRNPWTPGQIGASPIQHWSSMHVWLYIFLRDAPFNPWYANGLDRIGCFLCPASDLGDLELAMRMSKRGQDWKEWLEVYAKDRGLPEEWITYGLWRWKRLPQSVREELERNGVDLRRPTEQKATGQMRFHLQEGFSPCIAGFSIEGAFDRSLDLKRLANLLNMVDEVTYLESDGYVSVPGVMIYEEGALVGKGKDKERIKEKIEKVRKAAVKAEECAGCGVCIARCVEGALSLQQGKVTVEVTRCIHCGRCIDPCPATSFGDSSFEF